MSKNNLFNLTYSVLIKGNPSDYDRFMTELKSYIASTFTHLKGNPEELENFAHQLITNFLDQLRNHNPTLNELFDNPDDPDGSKQRRFQGYLRKMFNTVNNQLNPESTRIRNFLRQIKTLLENDPNLSSYKIRMQGKVETFVCLKHEDFHQMRNAYLSNKEEMMAMIEKYLAPGSPDWADNLINNLKKLVDEIGIIRLKDVTDYLYQQFKNMNTPIYDDEGKEIPLTANDGNMDEIGSSPDVFFKKLILRVENAFLRKNRARGIYLLYIKLFEPQKKVEEICEELGILKGSFTNDYNKIQDIVDNMAEEGYTLSSYTEFEKNHDSYLKIFADTLYKYNPEYYKFVFERKGDMV